MTIHFVLGGGMTEAGWESLGQQIQTYYQQHISGVTFDFKFWHYTDDLTATLNAATGPLLLVAHSFGGMRAVVTATALTRTVDHLLLFDPVSYVGTEYSVPNTKGFAVPANVKESLCFYRGATEAPYSGEITSGSNYRNVLLPPSGGGSSAYHGTAVWDAQGWGAVASVLKGGSLFAAISNPQPTPTPTPTPPPTPQKTLVKTITLSVYSDGSFTAA